MTVLPVSGHVEPTYALLRCLEGDEVNVLASVLDGGGVVSLTLECLSTPVHWDGSVTYSARLTGPVDAPLVPGRYTVHHEHTSFDLTLFAIAREDRFVHYEAYLSETL